MKKNVGIFTLIFLLLLLANYFIVKYYSKVDIRNLPGTYISNDGRFSDTLILFENHSHYHSSYDKVNKVLDTKEGTWGSSVDGYITIQEFSFSTSNYPVDAKYYYNYFWKICIDIGLSSTYHRISAPPPSSKSGLR